MLRKGSQVCRACGLTARSARTPRVCGSAARWAAGYLRSSGAYRKQAAIPDYPKGHAKLYYLKQLESIDGARPGARHHRSLGGR
jgi:hypothetical protein